MLVNRNRVLVLLAAGALVPAVMYGQQSNGSLSGRVTASDGVAGKAGVKVTVVERSTNLSRTAVTDADGRWRVPALPVGQYKVTMTAGSESHSVVNSVQLGNDTVVRFKWPAEASATIVVEALASSVDAMNTTSAEMGVNVASEALDDLPILDRNPNSAAVLAPGVQIIQGSQVDPTKRNSTYIVSGQGQGRGTSFNVDGADNNSSDVGGSVLPIPFDAIDQFQVVTNQYKAEFGRSNAGFMNVVTKSGGNDFAGAVNVQYTNQNMRARRTDETPKLANDQEIYSFTTSGPLIKDNLFYMLSLEHTGSTTGQSFDSRAIAAFPSLANSPSEMIKDNLYLKVDWNISQTWLLSMTYGRYYDTIKDESLGGPAGVAYNSSPSMLGTAKDAITAFGAKLSGTFGGNLTWESNAHYLNYVNKISPASPGQNNGFDVQVQSDYFLTQPGDNYGNGWDANAIQNTGVKRLEWKNELTWTVGEHSVKGGVDWQQTSYPVEDYFWPYPDPWLIFLNTSQNIGTAFNNLPVSQVSQVQFFSPVENPATVFHSYGLYLQDDWIINPQWSVFYGARVDWDTQLDSYSGLDNIYSTINANNPGLAGIGPAAPASKKYFSPRLQVLYKPFGDDKLTFKFGYGKFTASTIDNVVGFSRGLYANVNGFTPGFYTSNFGAGQNPISISGTPLELNNNKVYLPADLTPYNLANNYVNPNKAQNPTGVGLATFFEQMDSQLTPASPSTAGRSLLASNFTYPTTQAVNLGVTYKINEKLSIDATLLWSHTINNTAQYTTDDSGPSTTDDYKGNPMSDIIFMSNQTATQRELQVKLAYNSGPQSAVFTITGAHDTSSSGGSAGSFSGNNTPDFYGQGAIYPFMSNPERLAQGTQALQGSFSWGYKWDEGTRVSILGQWHSGKYYDILEGYNTTLGAGNGTNLYNPDPVIATRVGHWALDMGARISQDFKFSGKMVLQPFLQVQNILNNYDYGTSFYNTANTSVPNPAYTPTNGLPQYLAQANASLGQRTPFFQTNSPRTFAVGLRFVW